MDENKVNQIIAIYGSKLPAESINMIREKLLDMDYGTASVKMAQFKDPMIVLILSILTGTWGVDRFYLGDIGLGVIKLITCGGCGIWWLIDLILISDSTKKKNLESFLLY